MTIAKPANPTQVSADHTYIKRSHGEAAPASSIPLKTARASSPVTTTGPSTPLSFASPLSIRHSEDDKSWHPSMDSEPPDSMDSDIDDLEDSEN
jgi:hypothetical protein